MIMDFVQKIKNIGKSGECSGDDLILFLPNYPTLRGNEFIFKISWANASRYVDDEVEFFVKGLHFIEEKYKTKIGSDFGFGSPSPTAKVIQSYSKQNPEKAKELERWVAMNGGDFHIPKIDKFE